MQLNLRDHVFTTVAFLKTHTHAHTHTHLASVDADDAIAVARAVVKIGDGDSLLAGGDPVLLGRRVNLEDVGPGGVDRLLPGEHRAGGSERQHTHHTRQQPHFCSKVTVLFG